MLLSTWVFACFAFQILHFGFHNFHLKNLEIKEYVF